MIIKNGKVVLPDRIVSKDVLIKDGVIVAIGNDFADGGEVLDLNGDYLTPGFVDIHNHGGYGDDYMDNTLQAFDNILKFHSDHGITSAVASTVTAPKESILQTINCAKKVKANRKKDRAKLLGVHLEGPYLSFANKGAHAPKFLKVPKDDDYGYILDNADVIKHITVSPELEGCVELTKALVQKGIVVSMGHDNAILPELLPVVSAGANNLTHLYCAMSGVVMKDNKRYVGLREYGLIDDNLFAEVIADNHHITPELMKMIYKCKGADRISLISDCLRAGGMKQDGRLYSLGEKNDKDSMQFKVADGVAVLADGSKYAGSIQPISQMMKNVVGCGISLVDAVKMVSLTPATVVKENNKIGSIEVGKLADFNVLSADLDVKTTIVEGRVLVK